MTLTLIAERIHLEKGRIYIHEPCQKKYQEILFYPERVSIPFSPDILYLSRGIPPSCIQDTQLRGLICIAKTDEFSRIKEQVQRLPCSCLLLETNFPMEDIFNVINARILRPAHLLSAGRVGSDLSGTSQKARNLPLDPILQRLRCPAYIVCFFKK